MKKVVEIIWHWHSLIDRGGSTDRYWYIPDTIYSTDWWTLNSLWHIYALDFELLQTRSVTKQLVLVGFGFGCYTWLPLPVTNQPCEACLAVNTTFGFVFQKLIWRGGHWPLVNILSLAGILKYLFRSKYSNGWKHNAMKVKGNIFEHGQVANWTNSPPRWSFKGLPFHLNA